MLLPLLTALAAAADLKAHVIGVLTSNEFGARRSHTVRWTHSPTLAIIGGSDAHHALAGTIIADLSAAIAPLSITLIEDSADADIRLYFAPAEALPALAQDEGFSFVPGNDGMFWTWWDRSSSLTDAVILINDSHAAESAWMRHLLLEELTQSLGLMNDSPHFPQSVFYETATASGSATVLPPLDLHTIALLYSLPSGARKWRVRRSFRRRWQKLDPMLP